MKKIVYVILVFILFFIGRSFISKKEEKVYLIDTDKYASIDELYIYGNHLNLNGTIDIDNINDNIENINLIFYTEEEVKVPLKYQVTDESVSFKLGEKINNGYLLDNIDVNNYNLYIEVLNTEDEATYYKLKNNTNYETTEYYSIRKNKELKQMNFENKNDTINLSIKNTNNNDVYDIVIDPGHGGVDTGACGEEYCETDFTYEISSKIKKKLEDKGYKVKLTRDDLDRDEQLANYGENSRVDIANKSNAKYLLAIHLNSNDYDDSGVEVYTAYGVDYEFASSLAKSIVDKAKTKYSTNNAFKVDDGVYTRTLQNIDLKENYETAITNNYEPYDVSLKTTYYFIIRETGGYMSGAYVDGRDEEHYNFQVNSNVGRESYLIELGYLTSEKDTKNIVKNQDAYVDGIVDALINKLESED